MRLCVRLASEVDRARPDSRGKLRGLRAQVLGGIRIGDLLGGRGCLVGRLSREGGCGVVGGGGGGFSLAQEVGCCQVAVRSGAGKDAHTS